MDAKELGRKGEALARRYYEKNGYTVLEMNYRTRMGEVDVIAQKGGLYVFCEDVYKRQRIDSQLGMYAMLEHAWPAATQPGSPAEKKPAVPGARKTKRKERPQKKKKAGMLGVLSALWRR